MSRRENLILIPARLASTRLPRKLLLEAGGKPVLRHTWERCVDVKGVDGIHVVSGDREILDCCDRWEMNRLTTRLEHPNGTSRVAEAAAGLNAHPDANIVIVQGDEPEIDPAAIVLLFEALDRDAASAATLACPLVGEEEWRNPNRVKVVVSSTGLALYFSRAPIADWRTARRHIGTYAYKLRQLFRTAALPPAALERAENLEQLRHLAADGRMAVCELPEAHPGIDTESDFAAFRRRTSGPRIDEAG